VLHLAIDQGYTKTALAVADGAGKILFSETERSAYGELNDKEGKEARQARYQARIDKLIAAAAGHLKGQNAQLTYAGNTNPNKDGITASLVSAGCQLESFSECGDALGHYGLSSMPARAFVLGAGSGSIVSYIDKDHNFITPPEPHWEIAQGGNLLSAGGLSDALLNLYVDEQLSAQPTAISAAVEARLGKRSRNHSIYHYLYKFRHKISRGRRLELAQDVPALASEPKVAQLINRSVDDAVNYLRLLQDYFQEPAPTELVLGGSVALGIPALRELFVTALPGMAVELASGNPAEGVLRYRLAYPQANFEAQYGFDYFSQWKRA
jgi:N-acetylglucosamine kinase-like BadF-type ATPase